MSVINRINLLSPLTDEEKDELNLLSEEKFVRKGDVIFNEGDLANAMYILAEGVIEISTKKEGEKIVLGKVHSEEILGEMALFGDDTNRMATAIALTDSRIVTILHFSIVDLTEKYPELLKKIKDIINERMMHNKVIVEES